MTGRSIDRLRMARGRPVTSAIVRRAQMRAAFEYFARDRESRLTGIVASGFGSAARILWDATCFRYVALMLRRVPVGGPFPDVADHVVKAIAIWRKCFHR